MEIVLGLVAFGISLYVGWQFLLAGEKKLAGDPMIVGGFHMVGTHFMSDGDLLRRVFGFIEICSAALLVFPTTRPYALFLLTTTMLGAIYTHIKIFNDQGGWKTPAKLLGFLVILICITLVS